MAQWVPKTAWKVQSLNSVYGIGELGLHTTPPRVYKAGTRRPVPYFASPFRPVPSVFAPTAAAVSSASASAATDKAPAEDPVRADFANLRSQLKAAYAARVPFIDLRDDFESERKPLKRALRLHHHDLLSGAANEILPQDRANAQIVVFASTQQRVLNGYRALRRHGFQAVTVTNASVVDGFDD
jgi:hypothetical protein